LEAFNADSVIDPLPHDTSSSSSSSTSSPTELALPNPLKLPIGGDDRVDYSADATATS